GGKGVCGGGARGGRGARCRGGVAQGGGTAMTAQIIDFTAIRAARQATAEQTSPSAMSERRARLSPIPALLPGARARGLLGFGSLFRPLISAATTLRAAAC